MPQILIPGQVAFDDCDPAGVLFFGNAFKIAHRGIEVFLQNQGIDWVSWFASSEWAVPIKSAKTDYLKPLRAGTPYTLKVEVKKLGKTSVLFGFQILNSSSQICVDGETLHVFFSPQKKSKIPIPEELKACLTRDP